MHSISESNAVTSLLNPFVSKDTKDTETFDQTNPTNCHNSNDYSFPFSPLLITFVKFSQINLNK